MDFASYKLPRQDRRHVVLAPRSADLPIADTGDERTDYGRMFNEMQRLRGRIALSEGAIKASELTADGRHAAAVDQLAWHLLTLDSNGAVGGCVRMLVHPRNVAFEELLVSQSALAKCPERSPALRKAVEAELLNARRTGSAVVEVGGWVLAEVMRRSTEAVRLALGVWAWGRMLGGAVGLATATVRNHSACILGRIGGRPLHHEGQPISQYFEPKFGCDIQILRFASDAYSPRYSSIVESMCYELSLWPVLSAHSASSFPLCRLHDAVFETSPVGVDHREAVFTASAALQPIWS